MWLEKLRTSILSQITISDYAIIFLFALGGFAGFSRFPSYSDMTSQIDTLNCKPAWGILLFLFNNLLIYRKIRVSYFRLHVAFFHAFIFNISSVFLIYLAIIFFAPASNEILSPVIATQAGLAAVYIVVQGWIEFKPNLQELSALSEKIRKHVTRMKKMNGSEIDVDAVKRVSSLCKSYVDLSDRIAPEIEKNTEVLAQAKIRLRLINEIQNALKAPRTQIPSAIAKINVRKLRQGAG